MVTGGSPKRYVQRRYFSLGGERGREKYMCTQPSVKQSAAKGVQDPRIECGMRSARGFVVKGKIRRGDTFRRISSYFNVAALKSQLIV